MNELRERLLHSSLRQGYDFRLLIGGSEGKARARSSTLEIRDSKLDELGACRQVLERGAFPHLQFLAQDDPLDGLDATAFW